MKHLNELVIVSSNQGKVRAINYFLKSLDIKLITLSETGIYLPQSIEQFSSYEENAKAKGDYIFNIINKPVLSDDSGLEVASLKGEPGIYSSRYSEKGTDLENRLKLINNTKDFSEIERKAKFICVLYFRDNNCSLFFKGEVEGIVLSEEKGNKGFGYDPIFYYPGARKTFAEMSFKDKLIVSHRGIALQKLKEYLSEK